MEWEYVWRMHVEVTWRDQGQWKSQRQVNKSGPSIAAEINGGGRRTSGHDLSYRVRNWIIHRASSTSDSHRMARSRTDGLRQFRWASVSEQ